jgi:hypothetical protein
MTQPSNVISLAEVRAARATPQQPRSRPAERRPADYGRVAQAAPPPAPPPLAPPLRWRESARGNWWTRDARSGLHLVLYETRRGWRGRTTTPSGQGWYADVPPGRHPHRSASLGGRLAGDAVHC